MKSKFTLIGTDNNGFRHRYSIEKNEDFKKSFVEFMVELGFEKEKIFYSNYYDKNDIEIEKELIVKKIEDICWNYQNKEYDVDVFFGKFKIIIVVRTKKRVSMVEHLEKKAKWIKIHDIKKIQEKKIKQKKVNIPLQKIKKR